MGRQARNFGGRKEKTLCVKKTLSRNLQPARKCSAHILWLPELQKPMLHLVPHLCLTHRQLLLLFRVCWSKTERKGQGSRRNWMLAKLARGIFKKGKERSPCPSYRCCPQQGQAQGNPKDLRVLRNSAFTPSSICLQHFVSDRALPALVG